MLAMAITAVMAPVIVILFEMTDWLKVAGASLISREVTVGVLLLKLN